MTRRHGLAIAASGVAASALLAAGAAAHAGRASDSWGASAAAAHGTTVKLAHTSSGSLLVGPNGHTLYMFTRDGRNHDACVAISGCAATWPPFTVMGKASAAHGVRASLLGTTVISHGRHQVTYAGHPLYYYGGDSAAAETGYLGVSASGGHWYGVSASGGRIG
jgi:predicted lipoprotein with Yx(FWY)xxD motif